MRKLLFIFCLFTGSLNAQKPISFTKCSVCDTVTKVWYYVPFANGEFLQNETETESYFFDYDKNEVTDKDGFTYNVAYGMESTKVLNVLYFDDKTIEIHYTSEGKYIGHTLKKPLP